MSFLIQLVPVSEAVFSSHGGVAGLLSDSPLIDTYRGLAEAMNCPLAAGALPQTLKHQYFKINWRTALSLSLSLCCCCFCCCCSCVVCFLPGLIVFINMFSGLRGSGECRTAAVSKKTKAVIFEWGRALPDCALPPRFVLAADVQIKSFLDGTADAGLPSPPSPVCLCLPLQRGRALTRV